MSQQPPHSFAQKFVRGTILARLWGALNSGLSLTNSFFILAALSVYQFGLYQLILSALAIAHNFSTALFDDVASNDIARAMQEGKKADAKRLFNELAAIKLGLGVLITAALFFGADFIGTFYDKDIGSYIRIASFIFIARAIRFTASLFLSVVVSLKAMGTAVIEGVLKFSLISGFFLFSNLGVREVLMASAVSAFAAAVYVGVPFVKEYRISFAGVAASRQFLFKNILKLYGFWILLRYAASRATKDVRPWLVRTFLNTEAVAFFSIAVNILTLIQDIYPSDMMKALLSWEVTNPRRLRYIFSRAFKYTIWGGVILGIIGVLTVPLVIGVVFPKYTPAMPLFAALVLSLPLYGLSRLYLGLLVALREQKIITARLLIEIVLSVVVLVLLLPSLGLLAVAVERWVNFTWRAFFYYNQVGKKYPFLRFGVRFLLRFDIEDRDIFLRGWREAKIFFQGHLSRISLIRT